MRFDSKHNEIPQTKKATTKGHFVFAGKNQYIDFCITKRLLFSPIKVVTYS